jgi:hypothetical protein
MEKLHDRLYHDCYKYLKILFIYQSKNQNIENKKWKFSMISFIMIVIDIKKSCIQFFKQKYNYFK